MSNFDKTDEPENT